MPRLLPGAIAISSAVIALRGPSAIPTEQTRYCLDSVEANAFRCSGATARRDSDTLVIQLDTRQLRFVNLEQGAMSPRFQYVGRTGPTGFHVVSERPYEGAALSLILNPPTGGQNPVTGNGLTSP